MNDVVTARVHEPVNAGNPPTLVFGHGICVEFDHWRGLIDEVEALVKMGIRVVRPEAPSHGRRVPPGRFGGERFIATFPGGPLDHFSAAILEWAVLLDWCRNTSTGPVAVGGSSLGSMTAHLVADRAQLWPPRLHPDAMILITHSRGVGDAMYRGRLSEIWGVKAATSAAGWSPDAIQKFMAILDTQGPTVVAPENVVSILGNLDDVTPYDAGIGLLDEWKVPPENKFEWRCGHFSVPITMMRDHAPLLRFRAILERLQRNSRKSPSA
jgi:pimeloyl-ACP methyl ester carboxylesterase